MFCFSSSPNTKQMLNTTDNGVTGINTEREGEEKSTLKGGRWERERIRWRVGGGRAEYRDVKLEGIKGWFSFFFFFFFFFLRCGVRRQGDDIKDQAFYQQRAAITVFLYNQRDTLLMHHSFFFFFLLQKEVTLRFNLLNAFKGVGGR